MDRYTRVVRYLLDDRASSLRRFLEGLFQGLDARYQSYLLKTLDEIVAASGHKLEEMTTKRR
jgi:hypothetical protein